MNKLYFEEFNIEVTRKCNMNCAHCLNGDHQNIDIKIEYIEEVIKHINFIGVIGFGGGDPSLNAKAILETLNIIKKYNIPVLNTDIITNAKLITDEFIIALKEWRKYCSLYNTNQQDSCHITQDPFHENVNINNIQKLLNLGFAEIRLNNFKSDEDAIVLLGKGKQLKNSEYNIRRSSILPYTIYKYNNNFYITNSQFKLTCNGNIIRQCDYDFLEENKIIICNYNNIIQTFNKICIPFPKKSYFFEPFKNGIF